MLGGCAALPVSEPQRDPVQDIAAAPVYRWVGQLGGAELEALVQEAWRANPGLDAALAAMQRARAQAVITGSVRYPEVNAGLSAGRSRTQSFSGHEIGDSFGLSAEVSWLPDLWGRFASRQAAGIADAAAAQADAYGIKLMLAADVTRAWYRAVEAMLQYRLGQQRADNFAATLQVISERYEAGLAEALDVYLAKENLATAKAAMVASQQRLDASRRILESLLGRFPGAEIGIGEKLKMPASSIPAGIDSTVLLRRPDIQAWQQRLKAARARHDDALKNRFPSISLTARGGTQTTAFDQLLNWDNLVWNLLGGITQPLFQGGRLRAEQLLAQAQNREVLANYAQTVLLALREVQTTLAADPLLARQAMLQEEAARTAGRAAELALSNYQAGLIEIDTLLNTQRRAYAAQGALLTTRLNQLLNRVDLHLAIGGDYLTDEE